MKKAMLITFSLTTRVIVDENLSEEEMTDSAIAEAYKGIQDKINNRELGDNMTELEEDTEIPFGKAFLDRYFQPDMSSGYVHGHPGKTIPSFQVWKNKKNLMKAYPKCTPIEYSGDDIEDPTFMD